MNKIEEVFLEFSKQKERYKTIVHAMLVVDGGNMYLFDQFILGVAQKSLAMISGFELLMKENNFLAGAALIRLHLETLLVIYATTRVKDADKFIHGLMSDKQLDNFKDRSGKKMTYSSLMKEFIKDPQNNDFLGLANVYKETSKFVHFSGKHIFSGMSKDAKKENTFSFVLSDKKDIPEKSLREAIECMIMISQAQVWYVLAWVEQKKMMRI